MDARLQLLDHPVIGQRAFYPRQSQLPEPTLWVDVGDIRLGCHVVHAHPDAGWVLYFHGNGELASECVEYLSDLFTTAGVNVCFAEYRGYGASSGVPALASMLGDGVEILDMLGVPAERVVAFGRSLGSLYAIELARRVPTLAGLILESGIADLFEQWKFVQQATAIGCSLPEIQDAIEQYFNQQAKLSRFRGPVLVMHTERDRLVPVSHGIRLHEWAGGPEKKQLIFPDGDHNNIFSVNHRRYVEAVHAFLRECGLSQ